jgi:hypothetical protein
LVKVKVFLNGLLGCGIFVCELFKGLFAKNIFLKESFWPVIRTILSDKTSATLFAEEALFTIGRLASFNDKKRAAFFALFLVMEKE